MRATGSACKCVSLTMILILLQKDALFVAILIIPSQMLQDRSLILRRLLKDRSLLEDGVVGPPLDAVDVEAGEAGVTAPDGVCPRPNLGEGTHKWWYVTGWVYLQWTGQS